jgi:hypothetical protein
MVLSLKRLAQRWPAVIPTGRGQRVLSSVIIKRFTRTSGALELMVEGSLKPIAEVRRRSRSEPNLSPAANCGAPQITRLATPSSHGL